jgi:hypothetical protein
VTSFLFFPLKRASIEALVTSFLIFPLKRALTELEYPIASSLRSVPSKNPQITGNKSQGDKVFEKPYDKKK